MAPADATRMPAGSREELTPAWVGAALDAPVRAVEVLDAHSGTTGRVRLGVTYDGDAAGRPASVFVKLAPFDERQRRFVDAVGLGVAEARFYRDVGGAHAGASPARLARRRRRGPLRHGARGPRGERRPLPHPP